MYSGFPYVFILQGDWMDKKNYYLLDTVCEKDKCTGCMACLEVCAKDAIFINDNISSYNANIDKEMCINCGRCHTVCPNITAVSASEPIEWKQGWAKNASEREKSSSGGFAIAIAKAFIKNGGVVWSCAFMQGEFNFVMAEKIEETEKFRGSKYIKSSPAGIYQSILELLKEEKKVLFIGLPCQVAGLKNFVGERFLKDLYSVDLICHGTPSPKLLRDYLQKEFGIDLGTLEDIQFRNKTSFKIFQNRKPIVPTRVQDRYTMAFLSGLDYTQSCYSCKYAQINRISDVTIGDSWGSDMSEEEQRKGISLALCQTKKGIWLLHESEVQLEEVDKEKSIRANRQLIQPSPMPEMRKIFIKKIQKNKSFGAAVAAANRKVCIKQDIKMMMFKLNIFRRDK